MKLLKQIQDLDQQLDFVINGADNALAIKNLETIHNKIVPSLDAFESAYDLRHVYKHIPEGFAITGQNDEEILLCNSALDNIQAFLTCWDELEQKHMISQTDMCSNTRDSVNQLTDTLNNRNSTQYNHWIHQIKMDVEVLDSDLEQQENTPTLRENAESYRRSKLRFDTAIENRSISIHLISGIESLRQQVIAFKELMEFDQPDDVIKLFKHLKETGNGGRAPLKLLTNEVLEWIEDNGQEEYFYVSDIRIRNGR